MCLGGLSRSVPLGPFRAVGYPLKTRDLTGVLPDTEITCLRTTFAKRDYYNDHNCYQHDNHHQLLETLCCPPMFITSALYVFQLSF